MFQWLRGCNAQALLLARGDPSKAPPGCVYLPSEGGIAADYRRLLVKRLLPPPLTSVPATLADALVHEGKLEYLLGCAVVSFCTYLVCKQFANLTPLRFHIAVWSGIVAVTAKEVGDYFQWWPGEESYKELIADTAGSSIALPVLLLWERWWWPGEVSYKDLIAGTAGSAIALAILLLWERWVNPRLQQHLGRLVDLELSVREFISRNSPGERAAGARGARLSAVSADFHSCQPPYQSAQPFSFSSDAFSACSAVFLSIQPLFRLSLFSAACKERYNFSAVS
eukprot:gene11020-18984_t